MCVAVYKPAGAVVVKKDMHECFKSNNDGAGFAYLNNHGEAVIEKGFFNFKSFWKAFREHMNKEALIHFRYATHGTLDSDNCHPFQLPRGGAVIHNGIIHWCTPKNPNAKKSDTRYFAEDVLTPIIHEGVSLHTVKDDLEKAIGSGNKLAIFTDGKVLLVNERAGAWREGVWYSNMSWNRIGWYVTPRNYFYNAGYYDSKLKRMVYPNEPGYNLWHETDEADEDTNKDVVGITDRVVEGSTTPRTVTDKRSIYDDFYACHVCNRRWLPESAIVTIGRDQYMCKRCYRTNFLSEGESYCG